MDRYFDDFNVGDTFSGRSTTLTEAQIIDFALTYDPQSFHIDVHAAAQSHFGGLIASGFQTMGLCFRLLGQKGIFEACSLGGPAIDEIRFLAPVRPGDTLRSELEIIEHKASASKPDLGVIRYYVRGYNQHGDQVISFIVTHMLRRRQSIDPRHRPARMPTQLPYVIYVPV